MRSEISQRRRNPASGYPPSAIRYPQLTTTPSLAQGGSVREGRHKERWSMAPPRCCRKPQRADPHLKEVPHVPPRQRNGPSLKDALCVTDVRLVELDGRGTRSQP